MSDQDGIHVFEGMDNLFKGNKIDTSVMFDIEDDTVGGGTSGTANTYEKNKCQTSQPPGLCKNN